MRRFQETMFFDKARHEHFELSSLDSARTSTAAGGGSFPLFCFRCADCQSDQEDEFMPLWLEYK